MIIDCYTHIWDSPAQLGRLAESIDNPVRVPAARSHVRGALNAGTARHLASAQEIDTTIVLGFKSEHLGAEVPNDVVASYVQTHPEKLIGFAGIDPSSPVEAIEEMRRAREELGMKGIAIAPASQDQHPCSSNSELVYEKATEWNMPVLFHPGIQIARECRLEYAQPVLLDEVARNFPRLKIIIAHLGYPWMTETLVLLAKHDNVYSDVSWLLHQPWQAYQSLLSAHQFGVMSKLLFGSGFPYASATQSIETLYGINHLCAGTNLPRIPREALRGIVENDALELLGISRPIAPPKRPGVSSVLDEEVEQPPVT